MTSVIGTPYARAPRNVRTKNPQLLLKNKEVLPGSNGVFQNIEEVVAFMDKFVELAQLNSGEKDLRSAILTLCVNLKMYGVQLEVHYKDQLDRVFVHLRNAGRDDSLDKISRLHLLEVVELRAGHWSAQEQVSIYYQSKLNELQYTNMDLALNNVGQALTAGQNDPSPPASPLPFLLPGEVVKFSGKYNNTSSAPVTQAKNTVKDEVVIRNADSGKVMGIKGRRVHLIEEISDTVISFQRVNPGATERLVQITGAAQDNIERARLLIEQTIQRNASPVREIDTTVTTQSAGANQEPGTREPRKQSLLLESALEDYQHTVVVGQQSIKITGQSLDLVQTAKLILDEYFINHAQFHERPRTESVCSSMDDGVVMSCPSQESPRELESVAIKKLLKYNRESLLHWSNSPLCRQPPANFDLLLQNAPEIARQDLNSESFFDGKDYVAKYPDQLTTTPENLTALDDPVEDV